MTNTNPNRSDLAIFDPNSGERFASHTPAPDRTCGLTVDGRTLCWGSDDIGQVGSSGVASTCRTRCVTTPSLVNGRFVRLSAGLQYTCGVEREGATWCWGGHLPQRTKLDGSLSFTDLAGGRATDACGLTEEGRAYCWTFSYDDYYYYYGDDGATLSTPLPIGGAHMFSAFALGDAETCGLERDAPAHVLCWSSKDLARAEPAYVQRAGRP